MGGYRRNWRRRSWRSDITRRFIAALEAQTETLRAHWPDARQQAAVELLNELADALDDPAARPG